MPSSAFGKAFASARKAGKKEFTYNGKSYNTELKETVRPKARTTSLAPVSKPAKVDVPASKTKMPARPVTPTPKADDKRVKANVFSTKSKYIRDK